MSIFLITPFFIGVLLLFIYRETLSYRALTVYLMFLLVSPAFWELMTNGSDLIAVGVLFVLPLFLWKNHPSAGARFLILLLVAMVLTSRIVFVYLVPFYAFYFCGQNLRMAITYLFALSFFVFIIHWGFYAIDPVHYTPLLLVDKGLRLIDPTAVLGGLFIGAGMAWVTLQRPLTFHQGILNLWMWVAVPLLLVAIVSIKYSTNPLLQYPLTYLAPQMPLLLVYWVTQNATLQKGC
jgi:hypothetical protein